MDGGQTMDTSESLTNENDVTTTWIGTSNPGFANYAQDELRRLFPGTKCTPLIPNEIYLIMAAVPGELFIRTIREQEPLFLRHIQPVELVIQRAGNDSVTDVLTSLARWIDVASQIQAGQRIAVQARKASGLEPELAPGAVKAVIDELLLEKQAIPVVQNAELMISVFAAADAIYAGVSSPDDNLSDWSGGALHYRKEEGQISRAKFKLLEAEQRFGLDLSQFHSAVDIGAAPGGWTSLLLERGVEVIAIDPGDLHPSLLGHPKLSFFKRKAGEVRFRESQFDLVVCDMSWSPKQMAKLIIELLPALQHGGAAIITLKLMHGKPFQTVKDTVRMLEPALKLQRAKQLFHNRDELTLYFIKE
jgi:23S rRNA (cytidine2498-2'-O)-methyltransferase